MSTTLHGHLDRDALCVSVSGCGVCPWFTFTGLSVLCRSAFCLFITGYPGILCCPGLALAPRRNTSCLPQTGEHLWLRNKNKKTTQLFSYIINTSIGWKMKSRRRPPAAPGRHLNAIMWSIHSACHTGRKACPPRVLLPAHPPGDNCPSHCVVCFTYTWFVVWIVGLTLFVFIVCAHACCILYPDYYIIIYIYIITYTRLSARIFLNFFWQLMTRYDLQ